MREAKSESGRERDAESETKRGKQDRDRYV